MRTHPVTRSILVILYTDAAGVHPHSAFVAGDHPFPVVVACAAHAFHRPLFKSTLVAKLAFDVNAFALNLDKCTMHLTPSEASFVTLTFVSFHFCNLEI